MHLITHSIGAFIGGVIGFFLAYPTNEPCGSTFLTQPSCENFLGMTGGFVGTANLPATMTVCVVVGFVLGHLAHMAQESGKTQA